MFNSFIHLHIFLNVFCWGGRVCFAGASADIYPANGLIGTVPRSALSLQSQSRLAEGADLGPGFSLILSFHSDPRSCRVYFLKPSPPSSSLPTPTGPAEVVTEAQNAQYILDM